MIAHKVENFLQRLECFQQRVCPFLLGLSCIGWFSASSTITQIGCVDNNKPDVQCKDNKHWISFKHILMTSLVDKEEGTQPGPLTPVVTYHGNR